MKANQIAVAGIASGSLSRVADFVELTKPRIAVMVLVTVAAGGLLASGSSSSGMAILHAIIGTAMVAGGASVLNQVLEKHTDAKMNRTRNRPIPSGLW